MNQLSKGLADRLYEEAQGIVEPTPHAQTVVGFTDANMNYGFNIITVVEPVNDLQAATLLVHYSGLRLPSTTLPLHKNEQGFPFVQLQFTDNTIDVMLTV